MIKAVYPGTFDPLTRGHEDLVRRASAAVRQAGARHRRQPGQAPFFTLDERIDDGARGARPT